MCSGQNCSLARIPSLLQVFNPRLVSTNANQVGEGCKLAFLVNPTWFESNISDPFAMQYRDYVPMDLGWMMNLNDNDISTHCEESYNQSSKSECVCEDGFEGNPYLELGCTGKNSSLKKKICYFYYPNLIFFLGFILLFLFERLF
jgi:hypothetical protein